MKYLFLFSVLLFLSNSNFAQDTIVKLDGSKIAAKVIEINSSDVKYKKFSMPDGPTYVESKTKLD